MVVSEKYSFLNKYDYINIYVPLENFVFMHVNIRSYSYCYLHILETTVEQTESTNKSDFIYILVYHG